MIMNQTAILNKVNSHLQIANEAEARIKNFSEETKNKHKSSIKLIEENAKDNRDLAEFWKRFLKG